MIQVFSGRYRIRNIYMILDIFVGRHQYGTYLVEDITIFGESYHISNIWWKNITLETFGEDIFDSESSPL